MNTPPVGGASMPYPTLLSPLRIGALRLRNRLVMGSMHMRMPVEDDAASRLAAFYVERAKGGVAMIITGGVSPNRAGRMENGAAVLETEESAEAHRPIVDAVHDAGASILMQILHAGRYAKHEFAVGPSDTGAPINSYVPHRLEADEIEHTIDDYVRCARLARAAGYDGVDIMGSEGYLINQFTVARTNDRSDDWGGTHEKRMRFPVELVRRVRAAVGAGFVILFRISAVDLVEDGATAEETLQLAIALQAAGVDALSTGIGWHESRIPTIAYMVPRGAWRFAATRLKYAVSIPVAASNRINAPALAEEILAAGDADLVVLARPLLADPQFLAKARSGNAESITPCIACNQACLDYIFTDRTATCVVNPRAGREYSHSILPAKLGQRIAVVGAGAAGLAFALTAAGRGHRVTLFESALHIGGQLELARCIPGKEEFGGLLDHYRAELRRLRVDVRLGTRVTTALLRGHDFDRVVIATGVVPRTPVLNGLDHPKVASYPDVLSGAVEVGVRVAVIGAGAIAYDMAEFLTASDDATATPEQFFARWGVQPEGSAPGSLVPASDTPPQREVHLLQRSAGRPSARLGVSTGWIVRTTLKRRNVAILTGCAYTRVDDHGLHYTVGNQERVLDVDNVVICAGQEPLRELAAELEALGIRSNVIGGARDAHHLDVQRAIEEGYRLGLEY